jgi:hypothetical protein
MRVVCLRHHEVSTSLGKLYWDRREAGSIGSPVALLR